MQHQSPITEATTPNRPSWLGTIRFHFTFVRDQIAAFQRLVDHYGPVTRFQFAGLGPAFLIAEPELIEQVLVRHSDSFHKGSLTHELDDFVGRGLLTAEEDHWRNQRKLVAPNLQRKQIAHYADIMVDEADRLMRRWSDADIRELHDDMTEVTLRVVVRALFDLDFDRRIDEVGKAIDDTMSYFHEIMHSIWRWVPDAVPSPNKRAYRKAYRHLNEIVYDLIDERRNRQESGDDLLYRLIQATDEEGRGMTDKQLRDEVITLFAAGHETTTLAITYAILFVANHPQTAQRLNDEVDRVLGKERPSAQHVPELPYTEAVVKEAMRLYPPVWAIDRRATERVELDGLMIPEDAHIFMSQAVNHRSSRFFNNPDQFQPARWLDGLEDELPRFAYFPFGGGPRICIGNYFAMMEATLVIARLAQNWTFEPYTAPPIDTFTSITQRPDEPIHIAVNRR